MVTSYSTTSIRHIGPNVPTRLDVSERYLHIPICILRKDTFTNTCAYGVSHHCRTFLNTKMPKIKIIKNHSLLHENFAKKVSGDSVDSVLYGDASLSMHNSTSSYQIPVSIEVSCKRRKCGRLCGFLRRNHIGKKCCRACFQHSALLVPVLVFPCGDRIDPPHPVPTLNIFYYL